MTYAYMRVSTGTQDGDGQRQAILEWAASTGTQIGEWVTEAVSSRRRYDDREVSQLVGRLEPGDCVVTAELSRLARSMTELFAIVQAIRERGGCVVLARESRTIGADETIEGNAWLFAVSIGAQIERQMISERTKAALAARKAQGVKLGRPKGSGRSQLDAYSDEIRGMIALGVPHSRIAKKYGVTPATVGRWVAKHCVSEA